ncbi:MAG: ElyC/SanA/YdcF family protein [Nanoarchaeota archaeon]
MRNKFAYGIPFLLIAIISLLFSFNQSMTGNAIGTNGNTSYIYLISLISFILSFLILTSKQTLDAILIPTGDLSPDLKRTKKTFEKGGKEQVYLISGRIDQPLTRERENYRIYKELRDHGVRAGNIRIEAKSGTTLENVIESLEKLKKMGARDVGIASYPTHLDRFEYIIKKAKEEGLVDEDFRVHRLGVPETWGEHIYGVISNLLYKYELRNGLQRVEKPWFHKPIKKVISYFADRAKEKQR